MHLISLRVPTLASVSAGALLAAVSAQGGPPQSSPPPSAALAPNAKAAPVAARAKADDAAFEGLPKFLLVVPGGSVEMGLEAGTLIDAACQATFPSKPELAPKTAAEALAKAMKRSASTLGRRRVEVDTFLLGRWPVKCSEYEPFIAGRRKAGLPARPPFGWWRFGRKDDYEKRLPDITKAFPKDELGPLNYWDRFGNELPYELKDDKGNSIAELPLTFISWREANDFAASLGMRLPTEAEWTRAARGDGKHAWPCAKPDDPGSDRFTENTLKELRLFNMRDQVVKPVGTVQAANGPFGHVDMFAQVWQLVADLGHRPINGAEAFAAEWKKLQANKVGQLLTTVPAWDDDRALAKGGSYTSHGEPIQLLIDARAKVLTYDVLEMMGMRLAKSIKPGYDVLYSTLRGTYHKGAFGPDQQTDLTAQIGTERYDLRADGFPSAYHAVTFAPVNWLSKDKNVELQKLLEKSQTTPLLVGTLFVTDPLLVPKAPAGIYSVLYRKAGVPRELAEAVKQGHRELKALGKKPAEPATGEAADGKDAKEGKEPKEKKTSGWREVIARFGVTEFDVESKDAATGAVPCVRIDGVEIPVADDTFLLHDNDGKIVAAWPVPNAKPAVGAPFPSVLTVAEAEKGRLAAKFHFAVPLSQTNDKKVAGVHMHVVVDHAAPSVEKPWRLPIAPK
jgi:formylglycine-generating enzyme required for sulfatase activity